MHRHFHGFSGTIEPEFAKKRGQPAPTFTGRYSVRGTFERSADDEKPVDSHRFFFFHSVRFLTMPAIAIGRVREAYSLRITELPVGSWTQNYKVFLEDELIASASRRPALEAEAATLPKALIGDIEINWLQVCPYTPLFLYSAIP